MPAHRTAVVITIAGALLASAGCSPAEKSSSSTAPSGRETRGAAAGPPPARIYGREELNRALLPESEFPGFEAVEIEQRTVGAGIRSAGIKGFVERPSRSCAFLAADRLTGNASEGPFAGIGYSNENGTFAQALMSLPAQLPQEALRLRIPAGCERLTGTFQGHKAAITIKELEPARRPRIGGAEVSGLRIGIGASATDERVASVIIFVRSGSLALFTHTTGPGEASDSAVQNTLRAWTYARQRLT